MKSATNMAGHLVYWTKRQWSNKPHWFR